MTAAVTVGDETAEIVADVDQPGVQRVGDRRLQALLLVQHGGDVAGQHVLGALALGDRGGERVLLERTPDERLLGCERHGERIELGVDLRGVERTAALDVFEEADEHRRQLAVDEQVAAGDRGRHLGDRGGEQVLDV